MKGNKKRKVLIVGCLPPPFEGTAKMIEVVYTSKYLNAEYSINMLSLKKRKYATKRGALSIVNMSLNIVNIVKYIKKLVMFNPEIVYSTLAQNRYGFLRDSLFILVGAMFGKKICVHFYGGNYDMFYKQQNVMFKGYIKYVLNKLDMLILQAEKFKEQFDELVDRKKMLTIFSCLPIDINGIENTGKRNSNDVVKVLFMGYLSKAKGALSVAEAIPLVLEKYSDAIEFILCGQPVDIERNITFIPDPDYGYTKIVRIINENKLDNIVKIYTAYTNEEKDVLLSQSDIFVFPTYSEGCGLVVLEAMYYGLPVITTEVGALGEMLKEKDNCLFVTPGDYRDIADKIVSLAENVQKRKEMGMNNYKLVRMEYNTEAFCQQISKAWSSI